VSLDRSCLVAVLGSGLLGRSVLCVAVFSEF